MTTTIQTQHNAERLSMSVTRSGVTGHKAFNSITSADSAAVHPSPTATAGSTSRRSLWHLHRGMRRYLHSRNAPETHEERRRDLS